VTLVVIRCKDLTVIMFRMYKAAAVLSALMKVYTIPCHDRSQINVMLVLEGCTDFLQLVAGSSSETFPASSDGTYDAGNIQVEAHTDIEAEEEEEELNVKTEKVLVSEKEECIDEDCIYSEEENNEEEDIDTQEEEGLDIKEEVC